MYNQLFIYEWYKCATVLIYIYYKTSQNRNFWKGELNIK